MYVLYQTSVGTKKAFVHRPVPYRPHTSVCNYEANN